MKQKLNNLLKDKECPLQIYRCTCSKCIDKLARYLENNNVSVNKPLKKIYQIGANTVLENLEVFEIDMETTQDYFTSLRKAENEIKRRINNERTN